MVAALGYFAYTQCWFNICNGQLDLSPEEFNAILPGLFQGGPPISQQDRQRVADHIQSGKMTIAEHNSLPTIGTTKTSNYRTTRLQPSNPTAVRQIDARQKAAIPAAARQFAAGSDARMSSFCNSPSGKGSPLCKSNFSRTLFAESVGRLSN